MNPLSLLSCLEQSLLLTRLDHLRLLLYDELALLGDVTVEVLYPARLHHGVGGLADVVGDLDTLSVYAGLLGIVRILTGLHQFLEDHLVLCESLYWPGKYD